MCRISGRKSVIYERGVGVCNSKFDRRYVMTDRPMYLYGLLGSKLFFPDCDPDRGNPTVFGLLKCRLDTNANFYAYYKWISRSFEERFGEFSDLFLDIGNRHWKHFNLFVSFSSVSFAPLVTSARTKIRLISPQIGLDRHLWSF